MTTIDQILTGKVAPLGLKAAPSGIDKYPVTGRIFLGREGLTGDAQGDRKHHGGPDKALHHYAFEHYAHWIDVIGPRDVLVRPGAFGENLSTRGLTENEAAIGDIFRIGQAVVQVSQGRQPCWKLNARFDVPDMALLVQRTGLTGWYYRVIEEGFIEVGDALALEDRVSPEWTIRRAWRTLYVDTMNLGELAEMASLAHLPDSWRGYARKRLETRQVENWSRRLQGT
ncbi:MOSC domain-containing protein YiiM [Pseudaminobacter salicylatoxidans]|uniref:MOSC domain-containing protein YiiM n=1 Tax=Pseudaminobacter salicylatoxidans TaxID=93369 RepID=A0A316C3F6_PSESE|nr:MOSC domain-containing protein [Pseudaminobacter salicylatoxidans]PWJ82341.1 MOSC domain-containing protein YiiM [Pseudaminobacter salicylatoxidans]